MEEAEEDVEEEDVDKVTEAGVVEEMEGRWKIGGI